MASCQRTGLAARTMKHASYSNFVPAFIIVAKFHHINPLGDKLLFAEGSFPGGIPSLLKKGQLFSVTKEFL